MLPASQRIDVWLQKEWIGYDAPESIEIWVRPGGTKDDATFHLKMRSRGQSRPEWVSEELGDDDKPLVSGLYLDIAMTGDPPLRLLMDVAVDGSAPVRRGVLGPSQKRIERSGTPTGVRRYIRKHE
jgi:hypothetical protein